MARLLLESGGERREIKVTGPLTVGRSQTAGVYLDDKTLSREHTQFYVDHGRVCVRDLDSKNGTYVNGVMIRQPAALKPGDKVKVGIATFTVVHEAGDALPAVTAPVAASRPAPAPVPARTTVTAPQVAPVPRPRPRLSGPHPAVVFVYRIILIAVIVGGAYLSKPFFVMLLNKIQP